MGMMLIGSLIALMFLGVPVAFAILGSSTLYLLITDMQPLFVVCQKLINGLDSFPLIAVPLFCFAGDLMGKGGMSKRLVSWCECLVGNLSGGLGAVAIVACALFAALTGSGPATVAAIGGIMIPSMLERGYAEEEATGIVTAAGALGPIIPPSIPMIIYGCAMGLSIPEMFSGAIRPGLLITFLLLLTNYVRFKRNKERNICEKVPFSWGRFIATTKEAIWSLLMPVIILAGIYSGIFTPTEASAVACLYGLIISLFVNRDVSFKQLPELMLSGARVGALGIFISGAANLLSFIFTNSRLTDSITNLVVTHVTHPTVYIIVLMIFLFVVGALMDTFAAILIIAPLLIPAGVALGFDELFLGVLFVINLVVGFITPPFGCNLFTASAITGLKYEKIVKGILPYMLVEMVAVMVIAFCPWLITWLPSLMK